MLDVAIIGCGVIGAAAAYELSHYPLQTAIFEAENDVADCTTKANRCHSARWLRPRTGHPDGAAQRGGLCTGQGDLRPAGCAVPAVRQSGAGPQPGRAAPPAETV